MVSYICDTHVEAKDVGGGMFRIDPRDAVPIWKQIEEGVRRMIAAGSLTTGMPVPSVRDLARDLRVNPMTVSKAYQRLTEDGVLEVRRGAGTFVATGAARASRAERLRDLREAAARYAALAVTVGVSLDDALRALEGCWPAPAGTGGQR
jgi:GntR family transcriptional regulator